MTKRQINEPPTGYASSTWWSRGYQAAMHDLTVKLEEGGTEAVLQWIKDNTVPEFDAKTLSPRPEQGDGIVAAMQPQPQPQDEGATYGGHRLSADSVKLFTYLVKDAGNWSGMPLVEVSKEERGNLTQLKRAGLLTTERDDQALFATFTEDGVAFARQLGIDERYLTSIL